jgi:polysaccharide biosynthesis/export protein
MRQSFIPRALILALLPMLAMAAHAPQTKNQKTTPAQPPAQAGSSGSANAGYLLCPGDVVEVEVWKEPEISKVLPVRPDGKISLPLVNDVQAAGLTTASLAADLTEKLKKFISDPQVTVIVAQVNSQRVYVMGEVLRGGAYPLTAGMTVLQALSNAGGFTSFANPRKIYVLRQENGKPVRYRFNYKDVVKGRKPEENRVLQPGDTIVVP